MKIKQRVENCVCLLVINSSTEKRTLEKKKIKIPHRISIEQRPDIVNKKLRFGDWEMDTIVGKANQDAIVTLVERSSGFYYDGTLRQRKECPKSIQSCY